MMIAQSLNRRKQAHRQSNDWITMQEVVGGVVGLVAVVVGIVYCLPCKLTVKLGDSSKILKEE